MSETDLMEEFYGTTPYGSLRERARAAMEQAQAARDAAEEELIEDLTDSLWSFMRDQLGVPQGDLSTAKVRVQPYGVAASNASPVKVRNQAVAMKVGDVEIRARYNAREDWQVGGDVIFEYQGRSSTWYQVHGLAHLGQIMAVSG